MSEQDVKDAGPIIERIGNALDRIGRSGWPEIHAALAGYVRERRGKVRAGNLPFGPAKDLMHLLEEVERLADALESLRAAADEIAHLKGEVRYLTGADE